MRLLPLLVGACCNISFASAASGRTRLKGGHTPWASVRALLGSSSARAPAKTARSNRTQTNPVPKEAVPTLAPIAPPAPDSRPPAPPAPPPPPAPMPLFPPVFPPAEVQQMLLPPAPVPAPGFVNMVGAPGAVEPMPQWAAQQAPPIAGAPAAPGAAGPAGPAGNPCYACLPPEERSKLNKDLQDVAKDQAQAEVADAAEQAEKDSQSAIAAEGKKNLRGVQAANDAAVDGAAGTLEANSKAQQAGMAADSKNQMTAAEHESHVAAEFAKFLSSEGIKQEGAKTSAKYIADAQAAVSDLVKQIKKAGKDMSKELKTSASIGTAATNQTEKYVVKALNYQNYSVHFMDVPLAEVHKAQVAANTTEDAVRIEAFGTKFSTQAVEHGMEEAKTAKDMSIQANQTAKFIIGKVMKTKQGIVDATQEVAVALMKAENAHIEAQAATFQAEKLLKSAPR